MLGAVLKKGVSQVGRVWELGIDDIGHWMTGIHEEWLLRNLPDAKSSTMIETTNTS